MARHAPLTDAHEAWGRRKTKDGPFILDSPSFVLLLVGLYLVLGVVYSLAVPVFEAPD